MTEIATTTDRAEAMELLISLERTGHADAVSLVLDDPDMTYERWQSLGRLLGSVDRRVNWYIGDWLNHGEALFGETYAQGVEATTAERYSEAERITGKDHGTLMNIASICGRVARERRKEELGFWIHADVASLDAEDQTRWLDRALAEALTSRQLRELIRDEKNPPPLEAATETSSSEGDTVPGLSIGEQIEAAARRVYHQGQQTAGGILVPDEAWAALRSALGEE